MYLEIFEKRSNENAIIVIAEQWHMSFEHGTPLFYCSTYSLPPQRPKASF